MPNQLKGEYEVGVRRQGLSRRLDRSNMKEKPKQAGWKVWVAICILPVICAVAASALAPSLPEAIRRLPWLLWFIAIGSGFAAMVLLSPSQRRQEIAESVENLELRTASIRQDRHPPNVVFPTGNCHVFHGPFIGRVSERCELLDWLWRGNEPVCLLQGISGSGKSSLAYVWVKSDVQGTSVPQLVITEAERQLLIDGGSTHELEGLFWWTFPERETRFAEFIDAAYGYFLGTDSTETDTRDDRLHAVLQSIRDLRCLVVLDNLDRRVLQLRVESARGHASNKARHLKYEEGLVSTFLEDVATQCGKGRVLVTTTETPPGLDDSIAGCRRVIVRDLSIANMKRLFPPEVLPWSDAEWQDFGDTGGGWPRNLVDLRDAIQWQKSYPLIRRIRPDLAGKSVFQQSWRTSSRERRAILGVLAACRFGILGDTVIAGAVPDLPSMSQTADPIRSRIQLINWTRSLSASKRNRFLDSCRQALLKLVESGIVTYDCETKRYNLHSTTRGEAYALIKRKRSIHKRLAAHMRDWQFLTMEEISSPRDLEPALEYVHQLVRAGKLEDAYSNLVSRISFPESMFALHHLRAYGLEYEMYEQFLDKDSKAKAGSLVSISGLSLPEHRSQILTGLSACHMALGEAQRATEYYKAALSEAQDAAGFRRTALEMAGTDRLDARRMQIRCSQSKAYGVHGGESKVIQNLCTVYHGMALACIWRGKFDDADKAYVRALHLADRFQCAPSVDIDRRVIGGWLAMLRGDLATSERMFRRATETQWANGPSLRALVGEGGVRYAQLHLQLGNIGEAKRILEINLKWCKMKRYEETVSGCLSMLGLAAALQGHLHEAVAFSRNAVESASLGDVQYQIAESLLIRAAVCKSLDHDQALLDVDRASRLSEWYDYRTLASEAKMLQIYLRSKPGQQSTTEEEMNKERRKAKRFSYASNLLSPSLFDYE